MENKETREFKNLKQKTRKGRVRKKQLRQEPVHDYFFRKTYSDESNALDLFSLLLTKKEYTFFNWKTLRTELTTYFDKNWKERKADLVFSVMIQDEKKLEDKSPKTKREEAKFLFLFEHKSYRDTGVLYQLLNYQNSIYQKGREKNLIYPIIPVVFYHGEKDWKVSRNFRDFIFQGSSLKKYKGFHKNILNFQYRFLNLKDYNIGRLSNRLTTKTILILMQKLGMSQKEINLDFLEHAFSLSDHLTLEEKKEKIRMAVSYIEKVVPNLSVKVLQELKEKESRVGERIMRAYKSGFQIMKEEGREEGIKEGFKQGREKGKEEGRKEGSQGALRAVIKGMLSQHLDIGVISKSTGLSEKEVLEISKSLQD